MSTTYAQKQSLTQKKDAPSASSVFDASSQSESLQRKADMVNAATQRAETPRPNNTGMPDDLKAGIESLSGFSMDNVRVHYNSSKPATVQALAYTRGTDIHVAPGQEKHLPHEAWHVAQQMAGRVSPTTNINGMPVNDNAALEHEADVMGEKAVQCKMIGVSLANGIVQCSSVQRMAFYNGSVVNTMQVEGKPLFGRKRGDFRSDTLASFVDSYKKEMLTYIACLIQMLPPVTLSGINVDFGPHISVIITGGNWYIAINSPVIEGGSLLDRNKKNNLLACSKKAKEIIKIEFENLKNEYMKRHRISGSCIDIENYRSFTEEEQAAYIAYRWAAKGDDVIVTNSDGSGKSKGPSKNSKKKSKDVSSSTPKEKPKPASSSIPKEDSKPILSSTPKEDSKPILSSIPKEDPKPISSSTSEENPKSVSSSIPKEKPKPVLSFIPNVEIKSYQEHGEMCSIESLNDGCNKPQWDDSRIEKMVNQSIGNLWEKRDEILSLICKIIRRYKIENPIKMSEENVDSLSKDVTGDVCANFSDEFLKENLQPQNVISFDLVRTRIYDIIYAIIIRMSFERVVRVGGSKTPCNKCANEMMSSSNVSHNLVGKRHVVMMSDKSGSGYKNWWIPPKDKEHGSMSETLNAVAENEEHDAVDESVDANVGDYINPGNKGYEKGTDGVVLNGFDLNQDLHYLNLYEMVLPNEDSLKDRLNGYFSLCKEIEQIFSKTEKRNAKQIRVWREKDDEKLITLADTEKALFCEKIKDNFINACALHEMIVKDCDAFISEYLTKYSKKIENYGKAETEMSNLQKEIKSNNSVMRDLGQKLKRKKKPEEQTKKEPEEQTKKESEEQTKIEIEALKAKLESLENEKKLLKQQIDEDVKYVNMKKTLDKINAEFKENNSLLYSWNDFKTCLNKENVNVNAVEWRYAKRIVYEVERVFCKCISMRKRLQFIKDFLEDASAKK